jgi:hypothetical protein
MEMKKVFFILAALVVLISCGVPRFTGESRFIQVLYSPETYEILTADTVIITKADMIAGITIDAIDTVRVKGSFNYLTSDSLTTGYIKINPGISKGIGFNWDVRMDSLTIITDGKANLWITPVKR